jgi:integrase
MLLNDKTVRAAKPKDKLYRLWDGQGLYLEVTPTGSRRWVYKWTIGGKERRLHIGPLAVVSLKEARQARDEARRLRHQGIDPIVQRQETKRQRVEASILTVETMVEAWIAWVAQQKGWTARYIEDVRSSVAQHVYQPLGQTPFTDITPALLLHKVFAPLIAAGKLETARRLRQKLEQVWNHAQIAGKVTSNAAMPLKGRISAPSVTHFASAKEQELPALLLAVRGYGNRLVEHAVRLQVLTATRPGETRGAQWDEFDMDAKVWTIPAARTKRRRDHLVPLSTQAVEVLDSLRPLTGHGPVLFPSRSRWDVPMSENTALMVFQRTGFGHVTMHGFRSLFSTTCHEHGKDSHIIEACLAHLDTNAVRATYNKAQYLPQRRELLQWWGDRVERLCQEDVDAKGLTPIFPLDRG